MKYFGWKALNPKSICKEMCLGLYYSLFLNICNVEFESETKESNFCTKFKKQSSCPAAVKVSYKTSLILWPFDEAIRFWSHFLGHCGCVSSLLHLDIIFKMASFCVFFPYNPFLLHYSPLTLRCYLNSISTLVRIIYKEKNIGYIK